MILNPSVLALLVSSLLISFMVLYSAVYGAQILKNWDIASGSELQLALERKTYLISTILSYFLGIQIISLFLFVFTVDSLCPLFVGAMCAVGTLTVNGFGYPTLILKLVNFLLAGLWLIINHADNSGYDYPLIRKKYAFLMVLTPLILAESALEIAYFLEMKPDIITSCCGSLFSPASRGIAADRRLDAGPGPMRGPAMAALAGTMAGRRPERRGLPTAAQGKGAGRVFRRALPGSPACAAAAVAVIACISPLHLRAAHPPLPVLHAEEGVRFRRLRALCRAVRRRHPGRERGDPGPLRKGPEPLGLPAAIPETNGPRGGRFLRGLHAPGRLPDPHVEPHDTVRRLTASSFRDPEPPPAIARGGCGRPPSRRRRSRRL